MGEQMEQISDVAMKDSELTFVNLTILKEFSNITDIVRNEDFLEIVPKAKLRRLKWVPMFYCLKQGILGEMVRELNAMWQYENIYDKIESLENQKAKFAEIGAAGVLWRPQLCDVKAQLKASDMNILQKRKAYLEFLAKQYESRVNRLKVKVLGHRSYIKVLQFDIQKYQKKTEKFISNFNEKIENHQALTKMFLPFKQNVNKIKWVEKDLEFEED